MLFLWWYSSGSGPSFLPEPSPHFFECAYFQSQIYCILCTQSLWWEICKMSQGRPALATCTTAMPRLWHMVSRRAVLALGKLLIKAWAGEETNQTKLLRLWKNVAGSTLQCSGVSSRLFFICDCGIFLPCFWFTRYVSFHSVKRRFFLYGL